MSDGMTPETSFNKESKLFNYLKDLAIILVSLCAFVAIWWFLSMTLDFTALPTPQETFGKLVELFTEGVTTGSEQTPYTKFIMASLMTFVKGAVAAFLIAVPVGLLLGYIKPLRTFLTPWIEVIRPIAPIAWAPIFIISLGYDLGPPLVVFIGMFFPILTNVMFGVTKIDSGLFDAAKTLGANKAQIFTKIIFPSSVPYMLSGLKIALGVGWMCIVAAELYAPPLGGLGTFIHTMSSQGAWPEVYATLIIVAALGILTTGITEYAHKFVSKYMGVE